MSDLESRRLALYTGLTDRLGPELADMLMSFLPATSQVATSQDIERVDHEIERLRDDIGLMRGDLQHLSQRIDRLQQTTLAGFVAMIAALLAAGFLT